MRSRLTTWEAVMDAVHPHTIALIRKLESIASLAPEEKAALQRLPMRLKPFRQTKTSSGRATPPPNAA